MLSLFFAVAVAVAAAGPIEIAVLPLVPIDGQEPWLGLAVADSLGSGLLRFGQQEKGKKPGRPLSVFSWRETLSAARHEGLDVTKPLGPDSLAKLAGELGTRLVFTGSYKVKAGAKPRVLLKWRVVDVSSTKKPKEMKVETDLTTLSTKTDKLVQGVIKALGLKAVKEKPPLPEPVAAIKAYAQGLGILAKQSLDPQARVVLAPAELKTARELFAQAYKASPRFTRAKIGMVMTSTMLGEQSDITELIVGLHEAEPLDAMCLYYVLAKQGKLEAATKVMSEVTTIYPGFLAGLGKLGEVYLQAKQPKQAAEVFAAYSARVPQNPWARLMYAKALSRAGEHDAAIEAAQGVVEDFPTSLTAQLGLGVRLADAKKFPEAAQVLEKALLAHPDQPTILTRLSYVKLKLNQVDAALAMAKKAVEKLGDGRGHAIVGYAHANLGHALALKGKKEEALVEFQKAAELGVSVEDRESLMSDAGTKKLLEDSKSPLAQAPPAPASQPTSQPASAPAPAAEGGQWKENAKFAAADDWDEDDYDDQPDEGAPASAPASKPAAEPPVEEAG